MLKPIDVCANAEAWGGCDLTAAAYRVPDTLSARQRVDILSAIAKAAALDPRIQRVGQRVAAACHRGRVHGARATIVPGDQLCIAKALLSFVQGTGYHEDPQGEWWQGPLYTLEHGGDCEDLEVLLVALAATQRIHGRIVWIEQPHYRLNHVTAKLWVDGQWLWAETSVSGARLGEHPYDAVSRVGQASNLGVGTKANPRPYLSAA